MQRTKAKLVYVEWIDSHSTAEGTWHVRKEISNSCAKVWSVGWVLKESKHAVTLVSSVSPGEFAGDITIPKLAILKRKRIRP